jgi:hypothetical protein
MFIETELDININLKQKVRLPLDKKFSSPSQPERKVATQPADRRCLNGCRKQLSPYILCAAELLAGIWQGINEVVRTSGELK